jgi:hypothetical protein
MAAQLGTRHRFGLPTIHVGTEAPVEGRAREATKLWLRALPRGGAAFEDPDPEPTDRLLAGILKEVDSAFLPH